MNDQKPKRTAEDPFTDKAVDDILHKEADELLQAHDEDITKAFVQQAGKLSRLKEWFKEKWGDPRWRYGSIATTTAILIAVGAVPVSRYFVLNAVGVRARASIRIVDDKTQQPLKNVVVALGGQSVKTNLDGVAQLSGLKLGASSLVVQKIAYAQSSQDITLGLGDNNFGDKQLVSIGVRLKILVKDWLSGQPIPKADTSFGESSALSDEDGMAEMAVAETDGDDIQITVQAGNYIEKSIAIAIDPSATTEAALVADYPHYFVSNRSGAFDLYKVNLDGSDETLLLGGTGRESEANLELATNGKHDTVAFTSQRDNDRNPDGYNREGLFLVAKDGVVKKVTSSENIHIVGWRDNHLVYVKVSEGASASNPRRYVLISYDTSSDKEKELTAANYITGATLVGDQVFVVQSNFYGESAEGFYKIDVKGENKTAIVTDETWTALRTTYDAFQYQTSNRGWFEYSVKTTASKSLSVAPSAFEGIKFIDSEDGKQTAWVADRDGKGSVFSIYYDGTSEKTLFQERGVNRPVWWAGNKHLVYRVVSQLEVADYVISTEGGVPQKIRDVVNVREPADY